MSLDEILAEAAALGSKIDLNQLIAIATSAVNALPAIEQGVTSALPYIQALETVLTGGAPTADDWAALDARLDAGSTILQQAAAEPDPNA